MNKIFHTKQYRLVFLLFAAGAAFSSGCVSVDKKTRYRDAEGHFDSQLLMQIQPGETTGNWLEAHFGEPLFVDSGFVDKRLVDKPDLAAAEDVQISTWRFVRQRQKNTRVFLVFHSRNRQEADEYLHVVLEDDKVIKAWRDEFARVDIKRVMSALGYSSRAVDAPVSPPLPAAAGLPVPPQAEPTAAPPSALVPSNPPVVAEDVPKPVEPELEDHSAKVRMPAPAGARAAASSPPEQKSQQGSLGPASVDYPL